MCVLMVPVAYIHKSINVQYKGCGFPTYLRVRRTFSTGDMLFLIFVSQPFKRACKLQTSSSKEEMLMRANKKNYRDVIVDHHTKYKTGPFHFGPGAVDESNNSAFFLVLSFVIRPALTQQPLLPPPF